MDYAFVPLIEGNLSDLDFVEQCYRQILKREPDTCGLETHIRVLRAKQMTRDALVKLFLTCDENQERLTTNAPSFALTLDGTGLR
jgi:hypothetical protein